MILSSRGSDVAVRALTTTNASDLMARPVPLFSSGPSFVSERAAEITAVASAVRLIAGMMGSFILRTYTGDSIYRQPVLDSYQATLFQDPAFGWTSVDLWSEIATSIELYGNAFIWKTITRSGVEELIPMDPRFFMVEWDKAERAKCILFTNGGGRAEVTKNIIHIKGWSHLPGGLNGEATTRLHRKTLAANAAYEEYRGKYFDNDATPGLVLMHPAELKLEQRLDILAAWKHAHAGPSNVNRPGLLWGGMDVKQMSHSMRDAQGVEFSEALTTEVARMFGIRPASLLHLSIEGSEPSTIEGLADLFYRFTLMERMRRIERGLAADRDLFPDRSLYPRFDVSEFVRGDIATQAEKNHKLRQSGIITANEARAELGYAPHSDGDTLQVTPVGGSDKMVAPEGEDE
jgi:HK97 family phage portal protein